MCTRACTPPSGMASQTRRTEAPARARFWRASQKRTARAVCARTCSAANAARRGLARREQRTRRDPVLWLHKLSARGPAVWQMRWGGGGSSAHAGSQRHGSTSFRREASRRQPLEARRASRASTRKINTTQCAPGPAAWRIRRSGGGRAVAAAHEQAASGRAAEAGGMRRLGASRRHAASTGKRDTTRPAAGPAAWQMRGGGGGELGCNSQDQRALQNLAPRGAQAQAARRANRAREKRTPRDVR